MARFQEALEHMGDRIEIHAKFINTLSLLEYIGSRKIVKSQVDREITEELLNHMAEEIRHAMLLKHLALKLSKGILASYQEEHLLCGSAGRCYIQTVDRAVEKTLPQANPWLNYLLTTLLIEERAAQVYPIYETWLERLGHPHKLLSIIRDEDKHLHAVTKQVAEFGNNMESLIPNLRLVESQAFDQFMGSVLKAN